MPGWPISSALDGQTPGDGGLAPVSIPRLAPPCRAQPCRRSPSHALPSLATLRHAPPRHTRPCRAPPGLAWLAYLIGPGRPTPGDGGRSPRFDSLPCPASPRRGSPNLAAPCLARPHHAPSRLVGLSHQPWTANPRGRRPKPPFRFLALPSHAAPRHPTPCRTWPHPAGPGHVGLSHQPRTASPRGRRPKPPFRYHGLPYLASPCLPVPYQASPSRGRALPCHARPRQASLRHSSSQTSPRQSGGMMPSLRAAAIIPRCRLSARRTWHRRQRVRSSDSLLPPRFPLFMWSMWHSSRAKVTPQ
jgi:hypothetical protein